MTWLVRSRVIPNWLQHSPPLVSSCSEFRHQEDSHFSYISNGVLEYFKRVVLKYKTIIDVYRSNFLLITRKFGKSWFSIMYEVSLIPSSPFLSPHSWSCSFLCFLLGSIWKPTVSYLRVYVSVNTMFMFLILRLPSRLVLGKTCIFYF